MISQAMRWLSLLITKWGSPNAESVLVTADNTSLLVELIGVATKPCAGWMGEDGLNGEFQRTMCGLGYGYLITKLLEGRLIRGMPKPFHELHSKPLHIF